MSAQPYIKYLDEEDQTDQHGGEYENGAAGPPSFAGDATEPEWDQDTTEAAPGAEPPSQDHVYGRGSEDGEQADWLATKLNNGILFNHALNRWHIFNARTGIWAPDNVGNAIHQVDRLAVRELIAIATNKDITEKDRTAQLKIMRRLREKSRILSALTLLATHPAYGTDGDEWDADPNLLGCANGIVDLRTGQLLAPDPASRVSMTTKIAYRSEWTLDEAIELAPRTVGFLQDISSDDAALATFYLRWFGYCLYGNNPSHKFLILSGKLGFNGKGALKRLLIHTLGDYAKELDPGFYERHRWSNKASEARADLMDLKGARITFISEPTGEFNTEILKNHTGEDQIKARALNSNHVISWEATHTPTFLTNDPPRTTDIGHAIRGRVLVADFRESYFGRVDLQLEDDMRAEAEAVLRILVWHASEWWSAKQIGSDGLDPMPLRVLAASKAYIDSNDATSPFVSEWCAQEDDAQVAPSRLYDHYIQWFNQSEPDDLAEPLPRTEFGSIIGKKFIKKGRPATYRGIRPLDAMAIAEFEEPTHA